MPDLRKSVPRSNILADCLLDLFAPEQLLRYTPLVDASPVSGVSQALERAVDFMPDQGQKNRPAGPSGPGGGGDGPSSPKVDKPNVDELLKRMRKVDPDQAKRYRQRTGQ